MLFSKKKAKKHVLAKRKSNAKKPKSVPDLKPKPKKAVTKSKSNIEKAPKSVSGAQEPKREFLRAFKRLTHKHNPWDIWKDFIVMYACSISNALDKHHYKEREERYLKTIQKYNAQEQKIFPELAALVVIALEDNPEQDFLGSIFMELNLGNKSGGQFFTPYHVCALMAATTVDDILAQVKEHGYATINDPCCGAGATLIAAAHEARKQLEKANLNYQNHILLAGQDIDEIAALMCYIQLSLLGVAACVKVGNSLTDPMTDNDSMDHYWFTPIYFSDVWVMRRTFHEVGNLAEEESK